MKIIPWAVTALLASSVCLASVDPKNLDPTTKPSDDFYQYANGGWLKANAIPADQSSWGSFDEVQARNENIIHGILERVSNAKDPSFVEKLVGDLYASGMDTASVDSLGSAPLKPELDRIAALKAPGDIAALVAALHMDGVAVCFGFGSEQDPKNSEMVIAAHGQGGLGLPDRDYYMRDDDGSKKVRAQYTAHVAKMLQLAGDSAGLAAAEADAVMGLETRLARGSKATADLRDPIANYHLMPLGDAEKLAPHFDWNAYFAGMGLTPPASLDVNQPEYLQALDAELASSSVSDWRAYFRWHLIHDNASYLSAPFVDENFAFFGRTLTGTPEMRERWKRVQGIVDENVGEALGQLFVAEAFPPESKERVLKVVTEIRAALRDRIEHLEWMDDVTRAAALKKLDMFGVKIGYPDKWIDYSTLVIDRGPYVLNIFRANAFNTKRDLAKIGKPVDRGLWGMTPSTVNAYYNPNNNEIVFAAGILQPPFYNPKTDDAAVFGAIGTVIGHEMTHGFDDEGRQFDGKGNLSDWWSSESNKRFRVRAAGIVTQFSGYVAVEDLHVNGELTEGENIADLGGIKLAYTAMKARMGGKPGEKVDGFTPEQRFFLSFASLWRENQRPEAMRLQVNTDPHSPSRLRVNGPLSNLEEFASAFSVPDGAPMRRAADERVTIW